MLEYRQATTQTQTDTLIAVLRYPIGPEHYVLSIVSMMYVYVLFYML